MNSQQINELIIRDFKAVVKNCSDVNWKFDEEYSRLEIYMYVNDHYAGVIKYQRGKFIITSTGSGRHIIFKKINEALNYVESMFQ